MSPRSPWQKRQVINDLNRQRSVLTQCDTVANVSRLLAAAPRSRATRLHDVRMVCLVQALGRADTLLVDLAGDAYYQQRFLHITPALASALGIQNMRLNPHYHIKARRVVFESDAAGWGVAK